MCLNGVSLVPEYQSLPPSPASSNLIVSAPPGVCVRRLKWTSSFHSTEIKQSEPERKTGKERGRIERKKI